MPITLGCPSCGKRFRARDESAGKRVKCPYCAAPVNVPTAEEAAVAGAPTAPLPAEPPPAPGRPAKPSVLDDSGMGSLPPQPAGRHPGTPPPGLSPVASPDDWGAAEPPKPFTTPAAPQPAPAPFQEPPAPGVPVNLPKPPPARPGRASTTRPAARPAPGGEAAKTPDQLAAPGWRRTRAGLFWVLFGLLLFAVPGFVGFAKAVAVRSGTELPKGPGSDWLTITGYLNSPEPNSVKMTKEEMLDAAAYGLPVAVGFLFLAVGRLTCGAAPRSSGAKGMFALSGLFTFVALAGLLTAAACDKLLFKEEYWYASRGFVITAIVAEFWFLTGLAASGASLKRPKAARAVGMVGFVVALAVAAGTIGWEVYTKQYRPLPVSDDVRMYEQAAVMLGWLLVVGTYWRAVRAVRGAISEFLEAVEE